MKKRQKAATEKEKLMRVSNVYLHVVEDVINNVRLEFYTEGLGDNVLNELQSIWELKLLQTGALQEASSREFPGAKPISEFVAGPPVHHLNVPYSVKEELYVGSSSDAIFGEVKPSIGSRESVMVQYIPEGPSEETVRHCSGHHLPFMMGHGTSSSYVQQPTSWMDQNRRGVEMNMNETYEERDSKDNVLAQFPGVPPITEDFLTTSTGKRKHDEISSGYYIPQRGGATDGATDDELRTSMGDASNNEATGESEF